MRKYVKAIRAGRTDCVHHTGTKCDCLLKLYCVTESCSFYITPQQWAEKQKRYPRIALEEKPKRRYRKHTAKS